MTSFLVSKLLYTTKISRWSPPLLQSINYRFYSGHSPSYVDIHERFRPISDLIEKYQLHLEEDPQKLDEYAKNGIISQHTANFFKNEIAKRKKALNNAKRQSKVLFYIGFPLIILTYMNAHFLEEEEHMAHEEHPKEHVLYPYLHRLATKFPFGDGNHTLFHNPKTNYDPHAKE